MNKQKETDMRKYEDLNYLQENRLKQRAYYIPENEGGCVSLNGDRGFALRHLTIPM